MHILKSVCHLLHWTLFIWTLFCCMNRMLILVMNLAEISSLAWWYALQEIRLPEFLHLRCCWSQIQDLMWTWSLIRFESVLVNLQWLLSGIKSLLKYNLMSRCPLGFWKWREIALRSVCGSAYAWSCEEKSKMLPGGASLWSSVQMIWSQNRLFGTLGTLFLPFHDAFSHLSQSLLFPTHQQYSYTKCSFLAYLW